MMPCCRVGDQIFLAESTFVMEERFHWLFEWRGRHSESPPVIQETISQGSYHTHTQMISRVCLGTEPNY